MVLTEDARNFGLIFFCLTIGLFVGLSLAPMMSR